MINNTYINFTAIQMLVGLLKMNKIIKNSQVKFFNTVFARVLYMGRNVNQDHVDKNCAFIELI